MLEVEEKAIGNYLSVLSGFAFSSRFFTEDTSHVPLVRIRNILNHTTDTFYAGSYQDKYMIYPGDILVGMDGDFNVVRWNGPKGLLNQRVCKVSPISKVICKEYLYHWLPRKLLEINRTTPQTTVKHLSVSDIENIKIPFYPYNEQRRIAEILDTLDETIRKTEALIDKLKRVKEGLLHDLLTRGIDEHGQLRDPATHPEQFKDSPLGRIPRDWRVKKLISIAKNGISNGYFKKPELTGRGYRLINVSDLYQDFGIDTEIVERVEANIKNLRTYEVKPGDCFFTRSSLNLSGVAHCNIVREINEPTLYECHVMRVRPNKLEVLPEFFAHWCRSYFAKSFFMQRAKQVTMTTIAQPDIAELPIPIPSLFEQKQIIETLDSQEKRIKKEQAYLNKLKQLKKGLMDDLLTGKVRVNQLDDSYFKEPPSEQEPLEEQLEAEAIKP